VNLIDNSGLDTSSGNVLTYTHAPHGSAVGMWAAGNGQGGGNPAPVVNDQYVVLDLGDNYDLSQAYLWQMVQTDLLGRGIQEFRLYGSPAAPSAADKANPPAVYNLAGYSVLLDTTTLAPGPQSGPSTTQAFALTNATDVRTIYIDVISSYNTGPRIDIGAVELQTLAADFDFDGDVDGRDFLAWQRGYGTPAPTAVKSQGDADNDLDVDGADLSVWELQYGSSAPLVASSLESAAAEFSTAADPEPVANVASLTKHSVSSADLTFGERTDRNFRRHRSRYAFTFVRRLLHRASSLE
jgi:hypothetical protein